MRRLEGEAQRRRQSGLQPPRLARAQPGHRDAELGTEAELALERRRLVGVARDHERAAAPVADVAELVGEGGPRVGGAQAEGEQQALAEVGLGGGREHPRGCARCLACELAALEEHDGGAALRRAPCARQSCEPSADDDDVGRCVGKGHGHLASAA
jgi:hypothetical protein